MEDIFEKPQFFIDGASATDVHQGASGDCWFLAALMAVSAKPSLIDRLCIARNEKVGVYGFVFYRDGEWVYEVIDDKLFLRVGDDDDLEIVRGLDMAKKEGLVLKFDEEKLMKMLQKGGEALYFGNCKSEETWLPLIEKAYAKAHGDYFAIEVCSERKDVSEGTANDSLGRLRKRGYRGSDWRCSRGVGQRGHPRQGSFLARTASASQ